MLVLFDHGTPKGLAHALSGHTVHSARSRGWDTLSNGALLSAAEEAGFDLLLTTDRRIRYQQNLRAQNCLGRADGQHEVVAAAPARGPRCRRRRFRRLRQLRRSRRAAAAEASQELSADA